MTNDVMNWWYLEYYSIWCMWSGGTDKRFVTVDTWDTQLSKYKWKHKWCWSTVNTWSEHKWCGSTWSEGENTNNVEVQILGVNTLMIMISLKGNDTWISKLIINNNVLSVGSTKWLILLILDNNDESKCRFDKLVKTVDAWMILN